MKKQKLQFHILFLVILGVIFFLVYSWFGSSVIQANASQFEGHRIFSWPDAMANNYFVNQFIETGEFSKEEPYNVVLEGLLHPRSTNIVDSDIVPSGFLGLFIVFGWIGKIFGKWLLMYLTPIFAVLSLWLFYGITKFLINRRAGLIATVLLAFLAPFLYYANLIMIGTITFVFFLLLGFWLLIKVNEEDNYKRVYLWSCLSGLSFGLAVSVRYLEAIWVSALLLVLLAFNWKRIRWQPIVFFILGGLVPVLLVLYYNLQVYGEAFTVGYFQMQDQSQEVISRLPTEFEVAPVSSWQNYLKFIFMPFGFHPRVIWHNVSQYVFQMFWPYFALFSCGAGLWIYDALKKGVNKKQLIYAVMAVVGCGYLVIYYGSWLFVDNLVLLNNTIASSYTRYWLPLMIFILPIIAYLLNRLLDINTYKWLKLTLVGIVICWLSIYSIGIAYSTPGDGLLAQKQVINTYYEQYAKVDALIEENAIIINDRADKLFWPDRRVVMFDLHFHIFPIISKLADDTPFYYFTMLLDKDIEFINDRKINEFNLRFVDPIQIDDKFKLYKLIRVGEE